MDYTNWRSGQPNDYRGKEDCAHIKEAVNDEWNDAPCSFSGQRYLCQTSLAGKSSNTILIHAWSMMDSCSTFVSFKASLHTKFYTFHLFVKFQCLTYVN